MPRNPATSEISVGTNWILTNLALGYAPQDENLIGLQLAPPVPVRQRGGLIVEFDDSDYEETDDSRAPGGEYREISLGHEGKPFSLDSKGLIFREQEEDFNEAIQSNPLYIKQIPKSLMSRTALSLERQIRDMALNPNNYLDDHKEVIGAGSYWGGDGTSSADPHEILTDKSALICSRVGKDPNVLLLGRTVFDKMVTNSTIKEHFKHTTAESVTKEILARIYNVKKILVGSAVSKKTANSAKDFLWGNYAVLAYVNSAMLDGNLGLAPSKDARKEPSAFYTYVFHDHPRISNRWYDENTSSYKWKIDYHRHPVMPMAEAAYLFINPVLI